MIKLSIIIALYNEEMLVGRCLESIIRQSKKEEVEIICIDDGSIDNSYTKLEEYSKKYENIKVFKNDENKGAGYSRNRGLSYAKGKYIWFIDADDYITEEAIDTICRELDRENVDLLCFDLIRIDEFGSSVYHALNASTPVIDGRSLFCNMMDKGLKTESACLQVSKKEYLDRLGIRFHENGLVSEDAYFSFKTLLKADKAKYIKEVMYVYEKSEDSITTKTSKKDRFKGSLKAFCDVCKEFFMHSGELDELKHMAAYAEQLIKNIVEHYNDNDKEEIENWVRKQNAYFQHIYALIYADNFEDIFPKRINNCNIEKLKSYDDIIIYGAGKIAKNVIELINNIDKRIIGCVVTDKVTMNKKYFYGIEIKELDDLLEYKEALVVISTSQKFYDEIEARLKEKQFNNIMRLLD